jgi:Mn2+/Fe2+ NRAMP family transporter
MTFPVMGDTGTSASDLPRAGDSAAARPLRATMHLGHVTMRALGPGLASGAADNDPSGIATYSQAGAQLGFPACWIVLLAYPLVCAIQQISGRVGRATGSGIIGTLGRYHPRWIVETLIVLVVCANVINLGADLGAMADVLSRLTGDPSPVYVLIFGGVCGGLLLLVRYQRYIRLVRWATLSLLTYVLAALSAPMPWGGIGASPAAPALTPNAASAAAIFAAVLGTTISPYLFVWQSSLEAERARALPRLGQSLSAPRSVQREIGRIRFDTGVGMAVATLVSLAVIVTAAATLHASGVWDIQTSSQAAEALRPAAGPLAYVLFSLGIISTGLLAVPMLAGSTAYALAEGRGWTVGTSRAPRDAPAFYTCIVAATLAGVALNFGGIDPLRALLWSAMIDGLVAVPVIALVMRIAIRPAIMGPLVLSRPLAILGWLTMAVMTATAASLITTLEW